MNILPTVLLALAFLWLGGAARLACGDTSSRRCCCGTARSRSTRWRTCSGKRRYATSDDSRNNWLAGAAHHGRGLAQQPPPLPELGQPGLSLVGDRRDLLRPAAARGARPHLGPAPAAARGGRRLARVARLRRRLVPRRSVDRRASGKIAGVKVHRTDQRRALPGAPHLHADGADPHGADHRARHHPPRLGRIEVGGGRGRHPGARLLRDRARRAGSLGTIFVTRGASLAAVQNEFLSSVSHELRTPLTSIRMFIDTLREGRVTDSAEKQRCLAIINQELGPSGRPRRQADRAVEDRVPPRRLRAASGRRWPPSSTTRWRCSGRWICAGRHRGRRADGGRPRRPRRPRGAGSGGRQPAEQRLEIHELRRQAIAVDRGGRPQARVHLGDRQRSGNPRRRTGGHLRKVSAGAAARERGGARTRGWASQSCAPSCAAHHGRIDVPIQGRPAAPASASCCPVAFRKRRDRAPRAAQLVVIVEDDAGDRRRAGAQPQAARAIARRWPATARRRCARSTSARPDLVLLDISLPKRSGIWVLETLRDGRQPWCR